MNLEILDGRLKAAVDAWVAKPDWLQFWINWRGGGDGTDPSAPCVALVQYSRAVECDPENDTLKSQLKRLTDHTEHISSSATHYFHDTNHAAQLAALVQGIVATVQAASYEMANDQPNAHLAIAKAAGHYDSAWELTSQTVAFHKGFGDDLADARRSKRLLHRALTDGAFQHGVTVSTWLILQCWLTTLFSEPEPKAEFTNPAKLLLFQPQNNGKGKGHIQDLLIESFPSREIGLLVDPLTFGTTVLDESLQESLRVAFRCCRQSWLTNVRANEPSMGLKVSIDLPAWAMLLEGSSAGGLLTGGLLATARKKPLDVRRSATIAVKLRNGASTDDDLPLETSDVILGPVGSIEQKLRAAAALKVGLDYIVVHDEDNKAWLASQKSQQTIGVKTLEQLYNGLIGDARFEAKLEQHCHEVEARWERIAAIGNSDDDYENDEHRFECYVSPTYHFERRTSRPAEPRDSGHGEYDEESVPGEGDACLRALLKRLDEKHGLVVYDQAGAGKTVFSERLCYVAAQRETWRKLFLDRAPLILRLEGAWSQEVDEKSLPSLRTVLERDDLLRQILPDGIERGKLVDFALKEKRVIIILDGWDQFSESERQHITRMLTPNKGSTDHDAVDHCKWVITSRVHMIENHWELFEIEHDVDRRWTRVRINLWDEATQDRYFQGDRSWRQMVPKEDGINELLGLPLVLRMLRRELEDPSRTPNAPLRQFKTLSELFLHITELLLRRAIEKSPQELKKVHLIITHDDRRTYSLLEEVLCVLAFQMMLDEEYNGVLRGRPGTLTSKVALFKKRARLRFFHELDVARKTSILEPSEQDQLVEDSKLRAKDWDRAMAILQSIELNHRAVLESLQEESLAFRNRKIVECYAARYLSKYATDWDRLGNRESNNPDDPCAWSFNGDDQWKECWKLAIEMPRADDHNGVWAKSMAVLFRPTKRHLEGYTTKKSLQLRPTELMFRAWLQLKREQSPYLPGILADYRSQFLEILNGHDLDRAKLAAQLVPAFVLPQMLRDQQRLQTIIPPADQPAYVRVPPEGDTLIFWMANPENCNDEQSHADLIEIPAFWMMACTVSRAQYRLFDPHLEKIKNESSNEAFGFKIHSPDEDCPVICAAWTDGVCLSLWLGDESSLPTETEWEGAARGKQSFGNGDEGMKKYGSVSCVSLLFYMDHQQFHNECTYDKARRTLPVRWNNSRREASKEPLRSLPPCLPNPFGLWLMHGNVWQWCLTERMYTEWTSQLGNVAYRRIRDGMDESPLTRKHIVRGGHRGDWESAFHFLRNADDSIGDPDYIGVRLVWH